MGVPLSIAGKLISIGGKLIGLPSAAGTVAAASISTLGSIAGVTHWFDATTAAYALDGSGAAVGKWGAASVGSLINRVAGGPALAAYAGPGNAVQPLIGRGRLNGTLGGIGGQIGTGNKPNPNVLPWPMLQQNTMLQVGAPVALPASQDWWIALAWSKPNARQAGYQSSRPASELSVLLQLGTTNLLAVDNVFRSTVTGPDTGTLTVLGTAVSTAMPMRHCGTMLLVNKAGQGITATLNGQQVGTGIACPFGATAATLTVCGNGSDPYFGGGQVWFHEMAIGGTLSGAGLTQVQTSLARYSTGARLGLLIAEIGQSNEEGIPGGAYDVGRSVISYLTGALSVDFVTFSAPGGGLYYNVPNQNSPLLDAGVGTDPSTWTQNPSGQSILTTLAALPPIQQADLGLIETYWTESLSELAASLRTTYATAKPTFEAAWRNEIGYIRSGMPGRTAATAPVVFAQGIAFGSGQPAGFQMEADGFADLAADATFNGQVILPNTWACHADGTVANAPVATGGSHFSSDDHINNFKYLAGPVARALVKTGLYSGALPAAGTVGGVALTGPKLVRGQFCTSAGVPVAGPTAYVLATLQHDTGTALLASAIALQGIGWTVNDGWSGPDSRGTSIAATALAIVDATHVLITLASVPTNAASACRLMYCEGPGWLGTGNALTDNASTVPAPAGMPDVAGDLGPALAPNYPVGAMPGGVGFG